MLNTHNLGITHIDAPVHVPVDGKVYPGVPVDEAVYGGRAHHGTTSAYASGIVTRGILLDVAPGRRLDPGYGVTSADLEAAERHAGLHVSSGDAVVVRGGWTVHKDLNESLPGMTLDAVRWLAEREVSIFLGDIGDRPPGIARRHDPDALRHPGPSRHADRRQCAGNRTRTALRGAGPVRVPADDRSHADHGLHRGSGESDSDVLAIPVGYSAEAPH